MLENVNLKKKLSREEYKRSLPGLQNRLYSLEKACWDNQISSIIVLEGWDGSGKGAAIQTLAQRLDPRGFKLYPITAPQPHEEERPWLWRFWLKVPNRGEMVILDGSWYGRVLEERIGGLPEQVWRQAYRDILEFERMLADDGTVILKFFLHISKKEQKKRFRALEQDPLKAWRISARDWVRHERYDELLVAIEEMLELSESEYGPWTIVEATSRWHARKRIFERLITALETRLGSLAPPAEPVAETSEDAELRAAMDLVEGSALEDEETGDS
jgi:polyphosphate kinase 2 (PPK2 family)